jgi:eukaryotic-like serine/threonine-protein kinase
MGLRRMNNRVVGVWAVATVFALAAPAWAVIPGLTGPLQALSQMLPQILPFLIAGLAGAVSIPAWRERVERFFRWVSTPRGMVSFLLITGALVGIGFLMRGGDRSVIAAPSPSASGGGEWSMFRADLTRSGAAAGSEGPPAGKVLWSYRDPEARVADLSSSPAVVGSRVYAGSAQASVFDSSGMVYCIDANTGERVWQFQTAKQVFSSPAVVGGKVFIGEGLHVDTDCKLYCLDAGTGKKVWETVTRSHTESSPAVVGGKVYTGAGDDGVYCLSAATGKPIWHRGGMHIDASPAVANGKVFLGTGYGKLRAMALDAATGKPLWEALCDVAVWGPPAVVGDRVYFGIGNGDFVKSGPSPKGGIWCLEAATGKQVWRRDVADAVVTAISVRTGRVIAGCRDGKVYAASADKGEIIWSAECGGAVVASPAVDANRVYVVGGGKVHALELASGKEAWSLDLRPHTASDVGLFSSPALGNGKLYVGTSKEKLLCIGP